MPLRVKGVVAAAARAGRRHGWRLVATAIVVAVLTTILQIIAEDVIDRTSMSLSAFADLSASAVSLLGAVFLSGFASKLAGPADDDDDHADITIARVMRTLPWARLIGADVLVALIVVAGLVALVIPGLVALNLLAVVGPVIEIENRPVIAALRRSVRLVRPHFWAVALLVIVPIAATSALETAGPEPADLRAILAVLAIRGLAAGLVEAAIALILVSLCSRLIDLADAAGAAQQPPR